MTYFGRFGGRFVPETLVAPLLKLEEAYGEAKRDASFQTEFRELLSKYAGRPTGLYYAKNLSQKCGCKIYLKREDLLHTGSHKINNALGQALLAKRMSKTRVIAETGAGQHGVAAATVCALLNLQCIVYMGSEDVERQKLNVLRMRLLGAEVRPVETGSRTLKDAINEALRDYVTHPDSHYLIGSVVGPSPYPEMVRDFQRVIGDETRKQILEKEGVLPNALVACVGGGSNAMGMFFPFTQEKAVKKYGVEAEGAASLCLGSVGVLHGAKTKVLQDEDGQIAATESIAAGLDYPAVGPEHAFFQETGIAEYVKVGDDEALSAFKTLSRLEGIIPALESAHAVAYALKLAETMHKDDIIVVNLSGRGDKDVQVLERTVGGGRGGVSSKGETTPPEAYGDKNVQALEKLQVNAK